MKKILKLLDKLIIRTLANISPELVCRYTYGTRFRRKLRLGKPENFNEKILWLKLHEYNPSPLVVKCVDKHRVREYVASFNLEETLNELYGVYDRAGQIEWNDLPEKFVLKTTHGSGGNIICTSKSELNIRESAKKLDDWLGKDYGKLSAETYYSKVEPRIICEKYLEDGSGLLPVDYKIYCFNGEPRLILVISDRDTDIKLDFLSLDWERLDLVKQQFRSIEIPEKPENFVEFIDCARKLSKPFPFVRVDLYNVNNRPIFGELTFTPAAGVATYYTDYGLKYLGDMLNIEKLLRK